MSNKKTGKLLIIGGAIQNGDDNPILKTIAAAADGGPLVVVDAATSEPDGIEQKYNDMFKGLGVKGIELVDIRKREDAYAEANVQICKKAAVIFFSGGDQLRITSQIGDSPVFRCMRDRYRAGCMIAGTSAGAAAMPQTMIVNGPSDESSRVSALSMAPGLGFLQRVVIDSHFAERGRMGRLLGVVAQNPANLGVGIDENTAILVDGAEHFNVIGTGAVYVVDGTEISYSSLSEDHPAGVISIHDVKLHVLGEDDCFDLAERRPVVPEEIRRELVR